MRQLRSDGEEGEIALRRPTGSDVARVAGVSKSAVSRAFTGGMVSPEARARIVDAARTLKYRPSSTARSLVTSRSNLIGVAVTHLDNQFYPDLIERLSERLAAVGYRLVLFVTRGTTNLEPVIDELLGLRLDGVILASSSPAARVATECTAAGVPVMMFNNVDPEGRIAGVSTDNEAGGETVARYLVAAGHRRLGVVEGVADSTTSVERARAFAGAVRSCGLAEPIALNGAYTFDGAARAARALLEVHGCDALFCVNDHMALAACQEARMLGKLPGRDVSIVGFDNVGIGGWPAFGLTTYAQPIEAMVEVAVRDLLARIGGRGGRNGISRLAGRLIVRDSARRAPGAVRDGDGTLVWRP